MNLLHEPFLIVDCQTTGANPNIGNLLEIAWCQASAADQSPGQVSSYLVKQPDEEGIPNRIQSLTGITELDMAGAWSALDVYNTVNEAVSRCQNDHAIVHYASFERPFLRDLFNRNGHENFPLNLLCTFQIARRLFPNLPTKGIRGLGGFFGAGNCELKRSAHHVEMTWAIWKGLVMNLAQKGINTNDDLQNWLALPITTKRTKYEYPLAPSKRLCLPNRPGIYKMLNQKGEILYVGKASSLKMRVNSYFRGQTGKDPRKLEMLTQTYDIAYQECSSALEAALLETDEIKRCDPPYNVSLKRNQRALLFFSPDFATKSSEQSDRHPIGPFSGPFVFEQFELLQKWQLTQEPDTSIFFDLVSADLIEAGFTLFCSINSVSPLQLASLRSMTALALKLLRAHSRLPHVIASDSAQDENDDEADREDKTDEIVELTAEDVADKFYRMFIRSAKAYMRSRVLTRLLNCRVTFKEEASIRELDFIRGQQTSNHNGTLPTSSLNQPAPEVNDIMLWSGLDIVTYDRLSVLLAEIIKMRSAERSIMIQPEISTDIVRHLSVQPRLSSCSLDIQN